MSNLRQKRDAVANASLNLARIRNWQQIAIERAVQLELAAFEVEEARIINDPARITVADRYFHEAKRMHAAAERKLADIA